MGLTAKQIKRGLDHVAGIEPALARQLATHGLPQPRIRPRGYATLLRTIVGQQVSVAAASSVWRKLEAEVGVGVPPQELLARDFDALRACGLSRQKQSYARSLAELITRGEVDLARLPTDDEAAIAALTRIKGIGRWSAEIYLLFAEGRPDIWPAGDLAIMASIGAILDLPERPDEPATRALAQGWRPHRGAVAVFAWHIYNKAAM